MTPESPTDEQTQATASVVRRGHQVVYVVLGAITAVFTWILVFHDLLAMLLLSAAVLAAILLKPFEVRERVELTTEADGATVRDELAGPDNVFFQPWLYTADEVRMHEDGTGATLRSSDLLGLTSTEYRLTAEPVATADEPGTQGGSRSDAVRVRFDREGHSYVECDVEIVERSDRTHVSLRTLRSPMSSFEVVVALLVAAVAPFEALAESYGYDVVDGATSVGLASPFSRRSPG